MSVMIRSKFAVSILTRPEKWLSFFAEKFLDEPWKIIQALDQFEFWNDPKKSFLRQLDGTPLISLIASFGDSFECVQLLKCCKWIRHSILRHRMPKGSWELYQANMMTHMPLPTSTFRHLVSNLSCIQWNSTCTRTVSGQRFSTIEFQFNVLEQVLKICLNLAEVHIDQKVDSQPKWVSLIQSFPKLEWYLEGTVSDPYILQPVQKQVRHVMTHDPQIFSQLTHFTVPFLELNCFLPQLSSLTFLDLTKHRVIDCRLNAFTRKAWFEGIRNLPRLKHLVLAVKVEPEKDPKPDYLPPGLSQLSTLFLSLVSDTKLPPLVLELTRFPKLAHFTLFCSEKDRWKEPPPISMTAPDTLELVENGTFVGYLDPIPWLRRNPHIRMLKGSFTPFQRLFPNVQHIDWNSVGRCSMLFP